MIQPIEFPERSIGEVRRFLALSQDWMGATGPSARELVQRGGRLRAGLAAALQPHARMHLSLHIPKTAGLTFSLVLAELFKEDLFRSYWEITNCRGEPVGDFPANARCIHGHMNLERLVERFPAASLITWVREPVQRLVSFYRYWMREPDLRHPLCRALHEQHWTLLEFARREEVRNEMTRYFGPFRPPDFCFIGLFEELPESMNLFFRKFGLSPLPISHGHRNPDRRAEEYGLSDEEKVELAALNRADCMLYRECVERVRNEFRLLDHAGSAPGLDTVPAS